MKEKSSIKSCENILVKYHENCLYHENLLVDDIIFYKARNPIFGELPKYKYIMYYLVTACDDKYMFSHFLKSSRS